jgi:hypothetical protein
MPVRVNTLTKWWVEPNYVALPIPTCPLRCILSVRKLFVIKVTMDKGVLVDRRLDVDSLNVCSSDERSAMRLLIAVDNCLVMLGGWFECLLMYVQWIVIGFPVWFVFCVVQVESNI